MSPRTHAGFTFLEVLVVLALVALGITLSLPIGMRALDLWTVRTVRDVGITMVHRARMEARRRGGATLELHGDSGRVDLRAGDSLLWQWGDPADAGVELVLPRGRTRDELVFDARGLGRVTSRTLIFSRGDASASLVISSRGRASRR